MKDSKDQQFERCHGNGESYKAYKAIEHKLTDEFQNLTFELMVETYIRKQMNHRGLMQDRDYQNGQNIWRSISEELGILGKYPYPIIEHAYGHPMSKDVAREGKKRLGINL